jgi:2-polyprenyl-3-methyl-5-hydroxy-6-metoxy-1,4-benzoquinol methylase
METNEDIRNAYNRMARNYAGDIEEEDDPEMRVHWRSVFCSKLCGKKVLEVGCGPGKDSKRFHDMGLEVTASDLSEEFISIIKERYPYIVTHQMDMSNPDLPPYSFDGIYAAASFIHLPRALADKTLKGFQQLLKPGGVLFLSLLKSTQVEEYVIEDWGNVQGNAALFTCYDEDEMDGRLKKSGFEEIVFSHFESSVYANIPRLVERGVSGYEVTAIAKA